MRKGLISTGDLGMGLEVIYLGFSDDTDITKWGPGRRDQYIIHYVLDGKGYYNGNSVNAGQGFLINPGMLQEYHSDKCEPWHFFWVAFKGKWAKSLLPFLNADPDTLIFNYSFVQKLRISEEKILLIKKDYISQFELLEIFMSIFKNHITDERAEIKAADSYFNFAKNYIETNYAQKITVDEIAGKLGISTIYLYKLFCLKMGRSPKQYLSDFRLYQAKTLLKSTDMSISQIAHSVGFEDSLNFSKYFSKHEGCSPSRFREKEH